MNTGALDGIRVLEVGTLISGPFAGRLLGDMGADVIKIEPPGAPDPLRDNGSSVRVPRNLSIGIEVEVVVGGVERPGCSL